MSENETEDPEESEATEPVADADVDEVEDDDDVEGHMFGAALKPGGLVGNTAGIPDFKKGIAADLNAYTLYGGLGIPRPGEVSRPTRDQ